MTDGNLGSFGRISVAPGTGLEWALPSPVEMAILDEQAIAGGLASLELMERAGTQVVEALLSRAPSVGSVLVVCGSGNNGGDGLVVARLLSERSIPVTCVIVGAERYSQECIAQARRYPHVRVTGDISAVLRSAVPDIRSISNHELHEICSQATIVVDALLGTGQHSAPRGVVADLIRLVHTERQRRSSLLVVAVDIPSGVSGGTGAVFEPCIRADLTVAVECAKRGLLQFPARAECGEIVIAPIGIAAFQRDSQGIEFLAVAGANVPKLGARKPDTHKSEQGRVLVIGGSADMPGAPILAVLGALRSGAGLVLRVVRSSWVGPQAPAEGMNIVLEGSSAHYTVRDVPRVVSACDAADVVVLGPGIGTTPEAHEFVLGVLLGLRTLQRKAVIDADALTIVARSGVDLRGIPAIITPHPGEAARLLSGRDGDVQADRFSSVRALWERYGVVSLLKGAGTLVYAEGRGRLVPRGTPYLATAGSGDVLSGVIAACFHRCNSALDAAALGAYVHACAGERASALSGGPILASEVAACVPGVIGALER